MRRVGPLRQQLRHPVEGDDGDYLGAGVDGELGARPRGFDFLDAAADFALGKLVAQVGAAQLPAALPVLDGCALQAVGAQRLGCRGVGVAVVVVEGPHQADATTQERRRNKEHRRPLVDASSVRLRRGPVGPASASGQRVGPGGFSRVLNRLACDVDHPRRRQRGGAVDRQRCRALGRGRCQPRRAVAARCEEVSQDAVAVLDDGDESSPHLDALLPVEGGGAFLGGHQHASAIEGRCRRRRREKRSGEVEGHPVDGDREAEGLRRR